MIEVWGIGAAPVSDRGRAAVQAVRDAMVGEGLVDTWLAAGLDLALNVYDDAVGCCDQMVLHQAGCVASGVDATLSYIDDQCATPTTRVAGDTRVRGS